MRLAGDEIRKGIALQDAWASQTYAQAYTDAVEQVKSSLGCANDVPEEASGRALTALLIPGPTVLAAAIEEANSGMAEEKSVGDQICEGIDLWEIGCEDGEKEEKARCLAIATDLLTRGPSPSMAVSKEFRDGYSLAAQELAAGITGEGQGEK